VRKTAIIVTIITVIVLAMYWYPNEVYITVGDYPIKIAGFLDVPEVTPNPNYNPEAARQQFLIIGIIISAIFLASTVFSWYITIQLEKMEKEELESEEGELKEREEYREIREEVSREGYIPEEEEEEEEDIFEF